MSLTFIERRIVYILSRADESIKVSEIRNIMIGQETDQVSRTSKMGKKIEALKKKYTGRHKMLAEVDKILDVKLPSFKTIETILQQLEKDKIILSKNNWWRTIKKLLVLTSSS